MYSSLLTPRENAYLAALNARNGMAEATRLMLAKAEVNGLKPAERDELLVCSRIANEKMRIK